MVIRISYFVFRISYSVTNYYIVHTGFCILHGLLLSEEITVKQKDELFKLLKEIVGKENASDAIEDRICYGCDATRTVALPDYVVKPLCAGEISVLLKLANERRIPVYPRGAASGLTGGALALQGGIALDTARMNRIIAIERTNMTATVEAGVVLADFQDAVERKGLFYPPDPASREFCTVGGTLAECAGGLRCIKYGVTRDYVLSSEAVLPTGEIIHTGSRTMKSVVGYDIGRLLIGSEGTLCVFTTATLRLLPLPESVQTLMAYFGELEGCIRAATEIVSSGIIPSTIEMMDETTIACIQNYKPFDISSSTRAIILAESDGHKTSATGDIRRMGDICRAAGAISVEETADRAEANLLWEVRRAASPALYSFKSGKINEDVCVPRGNLLGLFEAIAEVSLKNNVTIACFGHVGDGNIHVNALYDAGNEAEQKGAETAVEEIFRRVLGLGGSISGEHGIGTTKSRFLSWEVGEREIALMRKIKNLLDPNNILNPGKIFVP